MTQVISTHQSAQASKPAIWTGRALSILVVLFLIFDGTIHLMKIEPVVESFKQLGLPIEISVGIGITELLCLLLYVIPRTSVLGGILLTGYLGGAIAIQFRINAPVFSTALFPVYLGILMWGGLYLRYINLRQIVPFKK